MLFPIEPPQTSPKMFWIYYTVCDLPALAPTGFSPYATGGCAATPATALPAPALHAALPSTATTTFPAQPSLANVLAAAAARGQQQATFRAATSSASTTTLQLQHASNNHNGLPFVVTSLANTAAGGGGGVVQSNSHTLRGNLTYGKFRHGHSNGHGAGANGHFRRGTKRKISSDDAGSTGSGAGSESGGGTTDLQPLYCKTCRVTLNAPAQAKQHYEGKSHSKKVKMFTDGTTDEDGSEQKEGVKKEAVPEIPSEIYCKVCGVSFNSPKQAQQHYMGKNHSKKIRATTLAASAENNHHHHKSSAAPSPASATVPGGVVCVLCGGRVPSLELLEQHLTEQHHTELTGSPLGGSLGGSLGSLLRHGAPSGPSAAPRCWTTGNTSALLNAGMFGGLTPSTLQASQTTSTNFTFSALPHLIPSSLASPPSGPSPTSALSPGSSKRARRDFSNFRTPSGNYYCSACNLTLNSDQQMTQHVDSKKHRTNSHTGPSSTSGSVNNNNNTTEKSSSKSQISVESAVVAQPAC